MATVYKAYQPSLDRSVAVKVLPQYFAHDPDFAARFEREARAIAKLDHPNILPVHDFGREGDLTYIVMKYVEAGTLKDMLGQPMPLDQAVGIISQVAGALDHAHKQGVIHRDVKPGNVLMSEADWALLSDFGLARMVEASVQLTKTGVGVGTPAYMSPEQGQGIAVDARSDVYSLGVMLYEMLTGRVPYEAETPMAVVIKHITAPLPLPREVNPAISETVERVILKALAKDPADRYQSAGELAGALKRAAKEGVAEAPPVTVPPPPAVRPVVQVADERKAPSRGGKGLIVGIAGLALLLLVAIGLGAFLISRSAFTKATPSATSIAGGARLTSTVMPATVAPTVTMTTPQPDALLTPLPSERMLYEIQEGDKESLHSMNLTSGQRYQLTSALESVSGYFSPDCQWLLVREKGGEEETLSLVSLDGQDKTILAKGKYAYGTFSIDGQRIVVRVQDASESGAYHTSLWDIRGRKLTDLGDNNSYASFSPDSQSVLFWDCDKRDDSYNCSLYLADRDGQNRLFLAGGTGSRHYHFRAYFAAEGQHVLYRVPDGDVQRLYSVDPDGGHRVELCSGYDLGWGSWTQGDWLWCTTYSGSDQPRTQSLYLSDVHGQQSRTLAEGMYSVGAKFSDDGRWVTFSVEQAEGDLPRLYVLDRETGEQVQLNTDNLDVNRYELSSDGSRLLLVARNKEREAYGLYAVSVDGSLPMELISPSEGFNWFMQGFIAPDNEHLLAYAGRGDKRSLYLMKRDGSHRLELAREAESAGFNLSADGQMLVFSSNREGGPEIYRADPDGSNIEKLVEGGVNPILDRRYKQWRLYPVPRPPTPTPTPEPNSTPTPKPTKTPTPTRQPTPSPTSPSSTPLTLQTLSPSSVDAGQPVTLGLRNKWGVSGETHAFECAVVAPDGSQSTVQGNLKSDVWAYMSYPDDFGASSTVGGEYQFICQVEGQQVKSPGFTVTGVSVPADPDREAAVNQLKASVESRSADALMPMAYGGSMVFGYYASGNAIQTDSYDEKRATTQRWLDQWAMQYVVLGTEQRVLDGLSQGIAAHKEATDRAVVIFRTGDQASSETPQVIFLLEKIEGRWWWTSMLLAIFNLAG